MKRTFFFFIFILAAIMAQAQSRRISGQIVDRDSKEPMMQTTVQLLRTDSSFVAGAVSDADGQFSVDAPANGRYLLKITSVGYKNILRPLTIEKDKDVAFGTLVMGGDAIMLKGATVTAMAAKVVAKKDTFIYNSSAYRTPEGSVVEELVRRLPGATIDDDGNITINGKQVKKIKVDGKEFMTGDTKTALKNLPTSIVDKIKAYDEKSDLARVSGIDDGEETTVLDFGIKKGMNKGMFSNIDLALGNHDRYAERGMGAYFNSNNRFMLFGSANNVNDMGFGGGRGGRFGGGRNGLNATKMLAGNYNYEKKDKLRLDASLRWNHNDGDAWSRSSEENFVSTTGAFSNNISQQYTRTNSFNGRMRLEWQPDSMTNIMFRPSFTWTQTDGRSTRSSASYNQDPYLYVDDALADESLQRLAADSIMVNSQKANSVSYSKNNSLNGMLQLNRKLSSNGRNVTVQGNAGYTHTDSRQLMANATRLWLMRTAEGLDSTYQTNRYNTMPTKNYSYSVQATYSEPIFKGGYLQLSYKYGYSHSRSDRSTYDFSDIGDYTYITPAYRSWSSYLSTLPGAFDDYLDNNLSRFSEYRNYTHRIDFMFRMVASKLRLNAGIMIQPQHTDFVQHYMGRDVDTARNVTNVSPTFDLRLNFSDQHRLRINYRATTTEPTMSQLLDITDDSNPLNISKGNPGLKPSFTQTMFAEYRNYIQNHQRFIFANLNFSTIRNSISDKVTYNPVTGGRVSQPENVNGNWNIRGAFVINTAIDSAAHWNVNTNTNLTYNNNVGYLSLNRDEDATKNTVKNLQLGESLGLSWRNDWMELELNGRMNYNHARNELQPRSDLDTWQYTYGADVNFTLPWNMSISTDAHMNSRRGYNESSMNTNEFIWNAQIAQSLLKGKALTLSLQFYDILQRQSNFSRAISATKRSDTEYNAINSYVMLHAIYRLNIFGSREARQNMRDRQQQRRPDFGNPNFRRGGGPGMPPPGGRRPMM